MVSIGGRLYSQSCSAKKGMGLGLLQSHEQHLHFVLIDVGHDNYRFSICSGFTHLAEAKTHKPTNHTLTHTFENHDSVSTTDPGFLFLMRVCLHRFRIAVNKQCSHPSRLGSDFGFMFLFFYIQDVCSRMIQLTSLEKHLSQGFWAPTYKCLEMLQRRCRFGHWQHGMFANNMRSQ